jgi:hypothetical protein
MDRNTFYDKAMDHNANLEKVDKSLRQNRRQLWWVQAQIEALKHGYWSSGIEGKYSAERDAKLQELLSNDRDYLQLHEQERALIEGIDEAEAAYLMGVRAHELNVAMLRGMP